MSRPSSSYDTANSSTSSWKHAIPVNDPRRTKKHRSTLQSSQDENSVGVNGLKNDAKERALLDDLMAGLDASIFDYLPSSPVASQKASALPSSQQDTDRFQKATKGGGLIDFEDLGVKQLRKREILSPTKPNIPLKSSPLDIISRTRNPKTSIAGEDTKVELPLDVSRQFSDTVIKVEEKKELFDDELFEFDFDLADVAEMDDETLIGNMGSKLRYPVRNPSVPQPPEGYAPTAWLRCKVKAVLSGLHFQDGDLPSLETLRDTEIGGHTEIGGDLPGKTLVVKIWDKETLRIVHLKERWADSAIKIGDIVNVISNQISSPGVVVITFRDPSSFIIHHPDLMLTMTAIANSMPCTRKPILQSLVKVAGPGSKAMLYGTILHGLLQGSLTEQDFSIEATQRRLEADLSKEERRLEVWGTGMGIEDVRLEVGAKAGHAFETFGRKWVGASIKDEGELHAQSGEKPSLLAITGLHDIEEDIWSPKWGLKGKVDASVQTSIQRPEEEIPSDTVAPLEIKTGRMVGVMAHRAQTMLYTLLMEDRYGIPIPAGLLYYSQLDSILRVEAKTNEIRALIMARNDLAHYLTQSRSTDVFEPPSTASTYGFGEGHDETSSTFLPRTIDNPRECKTCYASDICMLYRKMVDQVPSFDDDPIAELYQEKTGHLSHKDIEFFQKWETLLTLEEHDIGRFRAQLWTMTAEQREKTGRCFSEMVISSYSNDLGKSLAKIHRHSYTFVRSNESTSQLRASLLSGHIAKGDPVTISIDPDILCLSRGFVLELTPSSITIGVTYIIDTDALLARTSHRGHRMDGDKVVFRIDKDEMTGGLTKMRGNLAALFVENGAEKLRKLVVDLNAPQFDRTLAPRPSEIPRHFNEDQRSAMDAVLTTKDYSLILGMPGTGKTSTIAEIIKTLVARGKSVLLTSYTHSAVDTILMKLVDAPFGVLRLGNVDKVHPDVQHLTLEAKPSETMEIMEARLMDPPVVAATCLSVDHPLFFRRKFDYCIVDEASQITLPTCIGPLRLAERFVLVGDHFQLPPIVRNADAKSGGLDVSLFRLLSESHPQAVVDLSFQYRMNEDIMMLSNKLIYEGRLKCGSEAVAKRGLKLARKACLNTMDDACKSPCWIQDLLDEKVKAVFVDTDAVPGLDSKVGDLIQNEVEAKLVQQLAEAMMLSGLEQSDMAVITPYRQQIKLLTGLFVSMPKVEILTADKSQGRDKEVILISLVRSNDNGYIGDLLKDWRRINVSFTRAKSKLVIFGSKRTLEGDKLLKDFMELMESQKWIYRLPKGADLVHSPALVSTPGRAFSSQVSKSVKVGVKNEPKVKLESISPEKKRRDPLSSQKITGSQNDKKHHGSPVKKERNASQGKAPSQRAKGKSTKDGTQKGKGSLDAWLKAKPLTKDILADIA